MADITDIVAGAMNDAEEGIAPETQEGVETTGDEGVGTEGTEGAEGAEPISPSSGAAAAAAATEPAQDPAAAAEAARNAEIAEFAKYGIHPPEPGKREGSFKWSKVQRVVENARKKTAAKYEPQIREYESQIAAMKPRMDQIAVVDSLIVKDPDKYIGMLAALHPKLYGKFLQPQAQQPAPVTFDGEPQPDADFPDGTKGYSPAGVSKLMAYHRAEATKEAVALVRAEYDKRFGPIEQDWQSQQLIREKLPVVRGQIAAAEQTWGKGPMKEHEAEIVAVMDKYPELSFDAAVAQVLTPKLRTTREAMRKSILEELRKAPTAAARTAPGGTAASGTGEPRSIHDIVAESIRNANANL